MCGTGPWWVKEVNPWLANCPLVYNGRLANPGLTSLVKEATGDINAPVIHNNELLLCVSSIAHADDGLINMSLNITTQQDPMFYFLIHVWYNLCNTMIMKQKSWRLSDTYIC